MVLYRQLALISIFALSPFSAFAAYNDTTLTTSAVISVGGYNLNIAGSNAVVQSVTADTNSFSVTLAAGSSITVSSPTLHMLQTSSQAGVSTTTCTGSVSSVTLAYSGAGSITNSITPSATVCTDSTNPTPVPVLVPTVSSNFGGSTASGQVSNLLSMGFYSQAQQLAKQYGIAIPDMQKQSPAVASTSQQMFTRTLKVGAVDSDVKLLQSFLNTHGFTVAQKGVGSLGHETYYFGPATKAALMKFQLAYKKETLDPQKLKSPTGFFGVDTMKTVNAILKQEI